MRGDLVSSKQDFPTAKIYAREVRGAPVFSIVFKNRERRPGWQYAIGHGTWMLSGLVWMASLGGFLLGGAVNPWPAMLVFVGIGVIDVSWACWPYRPLRVIELDFATSPAALRVFRNGKLEMERRMVEREPDFTVEPHPEAEREYRRLQGKLGPKQKTHCLFGFFGAAGAEKVLMVSRIEYPNRDSLYEIRQAIVWVFQNMREIAVAATGAGREKRGEAPADMKPPLD